MRNSTAYIRWVSMSLPKLVLAAAMAAGVGIGETPRSFKAEAATPDSRFCRLVGVPSVLEALEALDGEGEGGARRFLPPSFDDAPRPDMMTMMVNVTRAATTMN